MRQFLYTQLALDGTNGLNDPELGRNLNGVALDLIHRWEGLRTGGVADDCLDQGGIVISGLQAGRQRGSGLTEEFELVKRGGSADNLNSKEFGSGVQDGQEGIGVVGGNVFLSMD